MAIRKNTKRIDPRYFLHETTYRDLDEDPSEQEALEEKFAAGQSLLKHLGITKEDWDQWSREDQKDARKKFRYYLKQSGFSPTVLNKGDSANLTTGTVTRDGVEKKRGTDAYDQYAKRRATKDASGKTGEERDNERQAAADAKAKAHAEASKQPWWKE